VPSQTMGFQPRLLSRSVTNRPFEQRINHKGEIL
jgi:hypothetical protein